jgi:hypothetical protein
MPGHSQASISLEPICLVRICLGISASNPAGVAGVRPRVFDLASAERPSSCLPVEEVVEGGAFRWHRAGGLVRVDFGWWDQPVVGTVVGDLPMVVVE